MKKFNGKNNIITTYDFKETEKNYYILMEYCDCDLKTFLKQNYPLNISLIQNIMRQIVNGYSFLYFNDYKHYDL